MWNMYTTLLIRHSKYLALGTIAILVSAGMIDVIQFDSSPVVSVISMVMPAAEAATPTKSVDELMDALPIPPDTTTDCMGPIYDSYRGSPKFANLCKGDIVAAHALLRKASLPCDSITSIWRDSFTELGRINCIVRGDHSKSGLERGLVFYESGGGSVRPVTQEEWLSDLKKARVQVGHPLSD